MPSCDLCADETEHDWPDQVYCWNCQEELMNWLRGYAAARPEPVLGNSARVGERQWIEEGQIECYLCGTSAKELDKPPHIEHVYPRSLGGSLFLPNIGLACGRCNSVKGASIIAFTDEQQRRYRELQGLLAERYAAMKPNLPAAVLQASTAHMWEVWGFDEEFDPGDTRPDWAAEAVVFALDEALWNDHQETPPATLPADFEDRCIAFSKPIIQEYERRGWFSAGEYDADEVPSLVREEIEKVVAEHARHAELFKQAGYVDP